MRVWVTLVGVVALAWLAGCTTVPAGRMADDAGSSPWAVVSGERPTASTQAPGQWLHYALPGKQASRFAYTRKDGRDAMLVTALSSASMLRYPLHVEPAALGNLRFSWKVPELIQGADMALREADDSPVRIVLAFDGDRSRLSAKNLALSELARALTGEELPYATLMYVWCNTRPSGSVIVNPRTDRIRKLVVQSGPARLNQWLDYERDIRADYEKAFGEAPGALLAIGIMTDTDNTRSSTTAWYGPVQLGAAPQAARPR